MGGKYGTLSEIAFALAFGKPIVGLHTWQGIEGMIQSASPAEAVETIFQLIETKL
ncbi:MAG TPA: hypothetical protein VGD14_23425 [bacterium]